MKTRRSLSLLPLLCAPLGLTSVVVASDDPELVMVPPAEPLGGPGTPVSQPSVTPPVEPKAEEPPAGEAAPEEESKWWSLTVGFDVVTAYYGRGFIVEDSGFMIQPYFTFAAEAIKWEGGSLSLDIGSWNSVHSAETDADEVGDSGLDAWFESDLLTGVTLKLDPVSLRVGYALYANPNRAADPIHELLVTLTLDDSGWMGPWALNPAITIAHELGDDSGDGFDGRGTYFELGITPGVSFDLGPVKDLRLNFPILVGLSIDDYYQSEDSSGHVSDDTFGYFQGGARLLVPLPMPEGWGKWTASAGVSVIIFGDGLKRNNADGRDANVVGSFGLSGQF